MLGRCLRAFGPTLLLGAALSSSPAWAAQVGTLAELGPALGACWHPPADTAGQQITVMFSLNRDGGVIGKPRITYSKLIGPVEVQRAFVAAVLDALAACTPVAVTPGLGGAIAGRPFSIRFIGGPKGTAM